MTEDTAGNGRDPKTGKFTSGNPGRPKGARNKLGEEFLQDLYESWARDGKDVLVRMIADHPEKYAQMIARLLPQDVNVKVDAGELFQALLRKLDESAEMERGVPAEPEQPAHLRH